MFNPNEPSRISSDQGFPIGLDGEETTTKDDYMAQNNFDDNGVQASQHYQQVERETMQEEAEIFPGWYDDHNSDGEPRTVNFKDTEELAQDLKTDETQEGSEALSA